MKKLFVLLSLFISVVAKAQLPAVNDTVKVSGTGAYFTPYTAYGISGGQVIPYLKLGTSNNNVALATTKYLRTYYASLNGAYANPAFVASLAQSKIIYTGTSAQYINGAGAYATFPTNLSAFTNGPGYLLPADISGKANLTGGNNWTGPQDFTTGTIQGTSWGISPNGNTTFGGIGAYTAGIGIAQRANIKFYDGVDERQLGYGTNIFSDTRLHWFTTAGGPGTAETIPYLSDLTFVSTNNNNLSNMAVYASNAYALTGAQFRYLSTSATNKFGTSVSNYLINMGASANQIGQIGLAEDGRLYSRFTTTGSGGFSADNKYAIYGDNLSNFVNDPGYITSASIPAYTASAGVSKVGNDFRADQAYGFNWTTAQTFTLNGLVTTQTPAITYRNTTAATSGVPVQISPGPLMQALVWNSTASASQTADVIMYSNPTSGASPTAGFRIDGRVNGGSYTNMLSGSSNGSVSVFGGFGGLISSTYQSNTNNLGATRVAAYTITNSTAATSGVPVQLMGDWLSSGSAWNTGTTATNRLNGYLGFVPVNGSTPSSYYRMGFENQTLASGISYPFTFTSAGLFSANGLSLTLGSDATNDIYFRNSSGNFARLAIGSNGKVLTVASGALAWVTPPTANVATDGYLTAADWYRFDAAYRGAPVISSTGSLTLAYHKDYVFRGTTSAYLLPALSPGTNGEENKITIYNTGTGTITVSTANIAEFVVKAGAQVTSFTIAAGAYCTLYPDGSSWLYID